MANKSIIEAPSVKVGVGVFVFRSRDDSHFCIGVRKASHGAGTWSLPGGHLEFGETFEQCAIREIAEETGLELEYVSYLTAVESMFTAERKHYVTLFMVAIAKAGTDGAVIEARNLEPEKCEGWHWKTWKETLGLDNMDQHLFEPLRSLERQRPSITAALDYGYPRTANDVPET